VGKGERVREKERAKERGKKEERARASARVREKAVANGACHLAGETQKAREPHALAPGQ